MKYFVMILVLVGFFSSFLFVNSAYALWWPLSPEELIEQSGTIFVGTISSINPVEVEYQSQVARNGTIKESIGSEVMTLEEYTVDVEEFLQNPQNSNTMKVLRATVSGVPSGPAKISGFEIGDRVLFYLPKDEEQIHFPGQYLPESFEVPKNCTAQNVLEQPRIIGSNAYGVFQDGMLKKGNFIAGTPMKFVFSKDIATLYGASIDVDVAISKEDENQAEFQKKIHVESEPCQWITSAEWEFTPEEGDYRMFLRIRENNETGGTTSYTGFSVVSTTRNTISPLKQYATGVSSNEISCKNNLVLISKHDGSPACVRSESVPKLIERGWADPTTLVTNGECTTDMRGYELTKPLSEVYVQRLVLFMKPDSTESFCVFFKSPLENSGNRTLNSQLYTGRINLEEYGGSDVSVSFEPKTASLEYRSKTMVEFNVTTTYNADGVYWLGIDQLGRLPVVVWEDRKSVGANEIPVYSGFRSSGNKVLDSIILGYENDKSFEYVLAEIEK